MMDELKNELKKYIIEELNLEDMSPEEIGNDEPLFGDGLGLDSIDALELVVILEQHYGIKIKMRKQVVRYSIRLIPWLNMLKNMNCMKIYVTGIGIISSIGENCLNLKKVFY